MSPIFLTDRELHDAVLAGDLSINSARSIRNPRPRRDPSLAAVPVGSFVTCFGKMRPETTLRIRFAVRDLLDALIPAPRNGPHRSMRNFR